MHLTTKDTKATKEKRETLKVLETFRVYAAGLRRDLQV
jgi:hypothetical protein